jgi:hypothetical protein
MSATRAKTNAIPAGDESPAVVPQTTPRAIGAGHPEYQFVQAMSEMQRSLGEINANLASLRDSVNGLKSKVDGLVAWKNMIFGGAIVFGATVSFIGFVIAKGWDYVSFKSPIAQTQQIAQPAPQPAPQFPSQPEVQRTSVKSQ